MARIRCIKPETPQAESLGRVSREARLFFILSWTQADDEGRLRGNSRMLASVLYPYDDDVTGVMVDGWLDELEREKRVVRYTINGNTYIQINDWLEHQKIDKPSKSKLPDPSREFASIREPSNTPAENSPRKGMEGKGIKEARENSRELPPADNEPTKLDELVTLWPRKDSTRGPLMLEWEAALMAGGRPSEIVVAAKRYLALPEVRKTKPEYMKRLETWLREGGWRSAGPPPNLEAERRSALLRHARALNRRPDIPHLWTAGDPPPTEAEVLAAREDADNLIVLWADTQVWDDALGDNRPDVGEVESCRRRKSDRSSAILLAIPEHMRATKIPA